MHTILIKIILLTAVLIVASIFIRELFAKANIPALIGFLALGIALRIAGKNLNILNSHTKEIFQFLADIGVILLLFRIGLESSIKKLIGNLKNAFWIGLSAISFSALLGYFGCRYLLDLPLPASLAVAAALAATSVSVPAAVWHQTGKIKQKTGQLFLDIAELDDIAGIIIMVVIFALLPKITSHQHTRPELALISLKVTAKMIGLLILFALGCLLFAAYIEKPMTKLFCKLSHRPDPTILVIAVGFIIAAVAGLLNFSLAIGAFFAGLVFSRDPNSTKSQTAFDAIYQLFYPFFFINIGLKTEISAFQAALTPAIVIFLLAVSGKFFGTALPALINTSPKNALILGVSMVPRAEITMIIVERASAIAKNSMPPKAYTSMVIMSILTCLIAPLILKYMLNEPKYK